MEAIKNFIDYSKRISLEHQVWQTAFRQKRETPLYKGNGDGFVLIPNNSRYWRADPFVFKYKNENYLFAEMLDRKQGKGVIGVAKLKGNHCSRFKICLELEHHLSYPCVFENEDGIFMIPECCESGEISVYKSVKFPIKWKKHSTLMEISAVDTTPLFDDKNKPIAYLTSLFDVAGGGNDNLYLFSDKEELIKIYSQNTRCRCGGHIINDGGKIIRPVQDDTDTYGNRMYFYEIDNIGKSSFAEHKYLTVLPPNSERKENEVSINLLNNSKNLNYIGIHTYNSNEDYEVIDLLVESQLNIFTFIENRNKLFDKYFKKLKRWLYEYNKKNPDKNCIGLAKNK